jgi:hypothetical protein
MARKKNGRILSGGVIVACIVLFCTLNVSAQFQAVEVTHTISGSVGVGGVTMRGLVGSDGQPAVTDDSGYYIAVVKWGWSGTVTPYKEGYNFQPDHKTYPEVTDELESEDYTAIPITYTISGTTGVEGVQMVGLLGDPMTTSGGSYSVEVPYGFTAEVTPTKPGYNFSPPSKQYRNIGTDMPRQDYKATKITLTISGTAGAQGVVLDGFPTKVVSGSGGSYTTTVDWDWTGTVRPVKQGYTFIPEQIPYNNVAYNQTNQDYIATPITYTITGSTGLAGVEMKGFPDSVFTDQTGYFTATVNWGWSGVVTPQKDGYDFKPASMTYSPIDSNRDNQVYEATKKTYKISGSTGQEGVQMIGLPDDPITGPGGSYSVTVEYGWNGTVIPTKEGYDFNPSNKVYPPVTQNFANDNYTASLKTFEIRGSVEVPGVTLQGAPGRAITSGNDGSYSISVPWNWNGTITPSKNGYEFNPPNMQFTNVSASEMNRNYTAALLKRTISGTITSDKGQPVEGVLITSDLNLSATTDAGGRYELKVEHGWNGRIVPVSEGHTFRPSSLQLPSVIRDMPNQNFTAIVKMVTIIDEVVMAGTPIPNVRIKATGLPGSTATDSKGQFSVNVPWGWTGELTLEKPGFNFNPPSKSYSNVTTNLRMGLPVPMEPEPTPSQPTTSGTGGLPIDVPPVTTKQPTTSGTGGLPDKLPPVTDTGKTTLPTRLPGPNEPADDTEIGQLRRQLEKFMIDQQRGQVGPGTPKFDPGTMRVTDTFSTDDLATTVLDSLSEQAGIPIISEESVYGTVTCKLEEVPLDTALDIVLAGTPYVFKKTPYYYLVSPADPNSPLFMTMSETNQVKLDYVTAASAVALLNNVFSPYVKADPDPNSHTVLVTASPKMMERIIADLEKIDTTPTHVMLSARIVVMERGGLLNLGIEYNWPTVQAGLFGSELHNRGTTDMADFGGKWPWGVSIGYSPDDTFTNALEMQLNLLQQNDEAEVVSEPKVIALDGKQAKIQVLNEQYFLLTPSTVSAFGYTTSYMETITSGTSLYIVPYIGDDDDITLEMAVEVSDSVASARGTDLPIVTRRTAENTVRIKDGGTAIVAGLTENRTSRTDRRVPGFSSLPLIGDLFKNKSDESATREIAVFVTANIVPHDQFSAGFMGQTPMTFSSPQQMNQPLNQPFNQQQPTFNQQQPYNQQPTFNQQQSYNQQPQYRTPAEMTPLNPFQQELINSTRTR